MLRMFYNSFQLFLLVFQIHVSSVSSVFRRVLQVLHLDVYIVDWVLHPPLCLCAASPWCLLLSFYCLASFSDCEGGTVGPMVGVRQGTAVWLRARSPFLLRGQE